VSLFAIEEEDEASLSVASSIENDSENEEHYTSTSSTLSSEYSASEDEYYSNAYEGNDEGDYYDDTYCQYGDDYHTSEMCGLSSREIYTIITLFVLGRYSTTKAFNYLL
jgi:hypothetical protein